MRIRNIVWAGVLLAAAQSPFEEAQKAYDRSDYTKAVELLRAAVARDPRNAEAYLLMTKSHLELERFDAAVQSAQHAVAISPGSSVYHLWLGKAYGEKADHSNWFSAMALARKAHKEFETAVQLDERDFPAQQDLIEYYCSAPGMLGGGEDKANRQIAHLLTLDPAEGHYARGNCRRQKKDFTGANEEFTLALESGARAPDLIFDIGDYALKQSQPERLLAVAEAGARVAPEDSRADFYRAAAYVLKREKLAEAADLLRAYLARAPLRTGYPRPGVAHEWLGRAFEARGDLEAARREYHAALQADPRNKNAHEALRRLDKH